MKVTERFLKYVSYPTASDENSETTPSNPEEKALGAYLVEDLCAIGLSDAEMDENGYVYATLPANTEKEIPTLGFIAHMDTSPEASGRDIRTKIVEYTGGDVVLNEEGHLTMRPLDRYVGQHLIVTDGTTLLGADDKAGLSEIVTAVENLILSGKPHGAVRLGFTPDEEVGRGADAFDVKKFAADYAYTVDGGTLGELEYENFNAADAKVIFHGVTIHPGSAKNVMKNASLMAMVFDALLPNRELPSSTEGYEGFHHLCEMDGNVVTARLHYIIRDHDREKFEEKKRQFEAAAEKICHFYGEDAVELTLRDSYYNMKEMIEPHMEIIERAQDAMRRIGVEPKVVPIRGGTDGARLSYMGLPCPNLCTGGENYHSPREYVPVESLEKVAELIETLITDLA